MKYLLIGCLICAAIAHVSSDLSANLTYPKRGTGRREFVRVPSSMPSNHIFCAIWSKIG